MKIKNIFISLLVITSMLMSNVYAVDNVEDIYVSATSGSDSGDGTYNSPLKTLQAAKKKVSQIKGSGVVNVNIMAGTYNISDLKFGESDSGSDGAEIVWKAYNNDKVILTSEQKLDNSRITSVGSVTAGKIPQQALGSVKQIKLTQEEIDAIGPIRYTGQRHTSEDAPAYLTQNGKMFEIAGYPNKVPKTILATNIAQTGEEGEEYYTYTINDERLKRWTEAEDAYLLGNPVYEWYEDTLNIASISENQIVTSEIGAYSWSKYQGNATLRIVNLVEEIDYPGEFYIDRQEGYLYFYPLDNIADSSFTLVTSQKPLMTFKGAQYISFENLIFEGTCSTGIIIEGSDYITLKNCEMRNIGKNAVDIIDSKNTIIEGTHIHDIGKQGITISGGDYATLNPNKNVITNCHIERYGKVLRRNCNAVWAYGLGDTISHNRIHAADHSAIMFGGNNNIIEYNDIYDVLNGASDAGVIYGGRSWVDGGTQIRYNYIHDNPYINTKDTPFKDRNNGKSAVYLDDSFAGTTVEGNVFANMNAGVKLHGSQYNNIKNNVFINLTSSVRIGNPNGEPDKDINVINAAINEKLMKGEEYFKSDAGYKSLSENKYRAAHTLYSNYFAKFNPYNTETDAYKKWDDQFQYLKNYIDPTGNHMTPKGNVVENNNTFTGGYPQVGDAAICFATYEDKGDTTQNIVAYNTKKNNNDLTSSIDVKNNGVLNIADTGIAGETSLTLNDFGVVYPKNQAYVEPGDQVLSWDEDSGADKYKLIISQNEDLSYPIVNTYVEDNYYQYEGLTAGTYYWTVDAETTHHLYTNKTKRINEGVMSFRVVEKAGVVTLSNIVYRNGDGNKTNSIENGAVNVVEFDLANNYSTGTTAVATLKSYDGNGNEIGEAKVTRDFDAYESVRAGVGITTSTDANAYMKLIIESGNSSKLEYRIDNAAMAGQVEEDKLAITSVTIQSGAIVNGSENILESVVKSLADGQLSVRCIMATYDSKGMLVDSDTDQFTMTKGVEHTFNTEALVSSDAGAYVKLFFWNDRMMPLIPDYDVK